MPECSSGDVRWRIAASWCVQVSRMIDKVSKHLRLAFSASFLLVLCGFVLGDAGLMRTARTIMWSGMAAVRHRSHRAFSHGDFAFSAVNARRRGPRRNPVAAGDRLGASCQASATPTSCPAVRSARRSGRSRGTAATDVWFRWCTRDGRCRARTSTQPKRKPTRRMILRQRAQRDHAGRLRTTAHRA